MRFLPANRDAVLVELETLEDTFALFSSLRESVPAGVIQMVPAARTVLIRFRQDETTARDVVMDVCHRGLDGPAALNSDIVEIPTVYDGEDLAEVAKLTGLTVEEVVQRHLGSEYTVAFCGFTPGFAYLLGGDPALNVPRRGSPRTRIPAGSVALAGAFSGVYPQSSPGGWQLIGRTSLAMWDIRRTPSALLQLGSKVRFVQSHKRQEIPACVIAEKESGPSARTGEGLFLVRAAPLPALFQDHGRSAQSGQGVSASGAADRSSFDQANRIVGNPYNRR